MELWILAGIAYFLMVTCILLFFKCAAILNEGYDETSYAMRGNDVLPDANYDTSATRPSTDLPTTSTATSFPSGSDQALAVGRQAIVLDKRATRSEIG